MENQAQPILENDTKITLSIPNEQPQVLLGVSHRYDPSQLPIHNPEVRKINPLSYYLTLGIRGILGSKKGSFSLLILIITTFALFLHKISGTEFVSAMTVVSGIYTASTAAVDFRNGRM